MKKKLTSIILLLAVVYGFFIVVTTVSALSAITSAKKIAASFTAQDLDRAKESITKAKSDFQRTKTIIIVFTPIRPIPIIGWYVADAQRAVSAAISALNAAETIANAITPYADVLGLKGQGTFLGGTAQERLASVVDTMSKVTPQLDVVGNDLKKAKEQTDGIKTWKYPNFLPAKPGEKIETIKTAVSQVEKFIVDTKPLIEVLPEIMGQNKEQKYLVLLQNNAELRPTGGFITAYALLKVNKGSIESELSEDIYKLDATLTKKVAAPAPIQKYLEVQTLNLRDSNLSPDFVSSAMLFEDLYKYSSSKKEYNGIIALDTNFVLKMINALGPVEVDGNKFTADEIDECACPQIIYELEKYSDQPTSFERGNRKGIIGVLMQQMLTKAFEAPKSAWPNILAAILTSLDEKDLILYFKDTKSQQAIEKLNYAGRIYEFDGDYLHISESNFGGAKSNLYVEEKVKQQIKKDKDTISKKVTIEYKYPRRGDNCSLERSGGLCLSGIYRDWIRIYTPKGSVLTSSSGSEAEVKQYDELGKTVFEGFVTVKPEGVAKLEFEYTIPIKETGTYKLLIQKQPGAPAHQYEIDAFGNKQRGFPLDQDKEFIARI